jgi:putative DNA methylase
VPSLWLSVADGGSGRTYLPFDPEQLTPCDHATHLISKDPLAEKLPREKAKGTFASNAQGRIYGFKTFSDYFTARQLVALTTFSDLLGDARERVLKNARAWGMVNDGKGIDDDGLGAMAYADAVATYMGLSISKLANRCCSLCFWDSGRENVQGFRSASDSNDLGLRRSKSPWSSHGELSNNCRLHRIRSGSLRPTRKRQLETARCD